MLSISLTLSLSSSLSRTSVQCTKCINTQDHPACRTPSTHHPRINCFLETAPSLSNSKQYLKVIASTNMKLLRLKNTLIYQIKNSTQFKLCISFSGTPPFFPFLFSPSNCSITLCFSWWQCL